MFEHLAVDRQVSVWCCLLHLLGCLVNKPGFVLTVKLLEIGQLNSLLLFPGPLVESLQTNLQDNPQATLSSCIILAVTTVFRGLSDPLVTSNLGMISHDHASTILLPYNHRLMANFIHPGKL